MTVEPRRGAAVLGSPIAHSLSPALHNAAYDALGLADWKYRAVECTEANLLATLQALDAEGLAGASLTMPLKRAVMSMLTYGGDSAIAVGAANTVLFSDEPGQWLGTNTDVPGMIAVLQNAGIDGGSDLTPWIIGAGATASSTLAALSGLGVTAAMVMARRPEAVTSLEAIAAPLGITVTGRPWSDTADLAAADLVVATTPAGSTDSLATSLSAVTGLLFDVVYAPWPTRLAESWEGAGGRVVGGLELLIEQAVVQVELMTGEIAPVDAMRAAGYAAAERHG